MTKDEALRLALEALKSIDEAMPFPVAKLAIKECTAALEAKDEPVDGYYFQITNDTMQGTIEALIAHAKRARWTNAVVRKDGVETTYEADWIKKLVPYTNPPQRTWVGLTDEDISEIYNQKDWDIHTNWDYERAIEAKLKEKNT